MASAAVKQENAVVPAGEPKGAGPDEGLFKLEASGTDLGRADSLRYNVLTWVLDERYEKAIQELKGALEKPSPYPNFHDRIRRYITHSVDLIHAIKAKRNFPGINSLTRAKQQELREKFKEHFKELQMILIRVEKVETDLRIDDARSTIYVVRALWIAMFTLAVGGFVVELLNGLGVTVGIVVSDGLTRAIDWLFQMLGL